MALVVVSSILAYLLIGCVLGTVAWEFLQTRPKPPLWEKTEDLGLCVGIGAFWWLVALGAIVIGIGLVGFRLVRRPARAIARKIADRVDGTESTELPRAEVRRG